MRVLPRGMTLQHAIAFYCDYEKVQQLPDHNRKNVGLVLQTILE